MMGSDPQQTFAMDIIRTDASLAIHRRNGHAKLKKNKDHPLLIGRIPLV